jgi:hypothetical protein
MASVMRFDEWQDSNGTTIYDGANGPFAINGYTYLQEVEFTSSGTFTKASYPDAKIFKVMVLGAGGGAGGAGSTNNVTGGGGGGGGYAERWVLVADMGASVTVTIGAGGSGRDANTTQADTGGASSFGSGETYEVSADGGVGGYRNSSSFGSGGIGGAGVSGTRLIRGLDGHDGPALMGGGAGNVLYPTYHYVPGLSNRAGSTGENPGQGASGGQRLSSGNNRGGDGADGYCRIEVYG